MADQYAAISTVTDQTKARLALVQGGKIVHVGMDQVGFQPLDADLTSWAAITRGAGFDAFAASIIGTSGYLVDSVTATYATNANLTTVLPGDDTVPTSSEGTEILSVTITPKTTTNKLRCRFSGFGTTAANTYTFCGALYQGTTCIDSAFLFPTAANQTLTMVLEAEYTPGAISSQTISVRIGPGAAGTVRMNGSTAARFGGGSANCTLVVEEIKA